MQSSQPLNELLMQYNFRNELYDGLILIFFFFEILKYKMEQYMDLVHCNVCKNETFVNFIIVVLNIKIKHWMVLFHESVYENETLESFVSLPEYSEENLDSSFSQFATRT